VRLINHVLSGLGPKGRTFLFAQVALSAISFLEMILLVVNLSIESFGAFAIISSFSVLLFGLIDFRINDLLLSSSVSLKRKTFLSIGCLEILLGLLSITVVTLSLKLVVSMSMSSIALFSFISVFPQISVGHFRLLSSSRPRQIAREFSYLSCRMTPLIVFASSTESLHDLGWWKFFIGALPTTAISLYLILRLAVNVPIEAHGGGSSVRARLISGYFSSLAGLGYKSVDILLVGSILGSAYAGLLRMWSLIFSPFGFLAEARYFESLTKRYPYKPPPLYGIYLLGLFGSAISAAIIAINNGAPSEPLLGLLTLIQASLVLASTSFRAQVVNSIKHKLLATFNIALLIIYLIGAVFVIASTKNIVLVVLLKTFVTLISTLFVRSVRMASSAVHS